ncbi:MAG TPA: DUF1508 domain-containing protein [Candidatus Limnocylindrales bacterium]
MGFEVSADQGGKYRWKFVVANGQTVATSGESFASKGNAKRAIEEFKRQVEKASVPAPEPDDSKTA